MSLSKAKVNSAIRNLQTKFPNQTVVFEISGNNLIFKVLPKVINESKQQSRETEQEEKGPISFSETLQQTPSQRASPCLQTQTQRRK